MRLLAAALAIAALSVPGGPLAAQASGAIAGRITDASSEAPLAGAVVTIAGGRRGNVSDTSGTYRIREVRSGVYSVTVRAIGFAPIRRDSSSKRRSSTRAGLGTTP